MRPDDPRHGEYRGWAQHDRDGEDPCEPCVLARRAYGRTAPHLAALGRPPRVPIGHKAHRTVEALADLTEREWRDHTGASAVTRRRILAGGPTTRVRRSTRRHIEQIDPEQVRAGLLTIVGCVRRVRALACLGHSATAIANESDIHPETVRKIQSGALEYVEYETRRRIAATYSRLEFTRLPVTNITARTFNLAELHKWVAPAGWDHIDDPDERPRAGSDHRRKTDLDHSNVERAILGEKIRLTKVERFEVVRRMRAAGWSLVRIEEHTGMTKVDRYIEREAVA